MKKYGYPSESVYLGMAKNTAGFLCRQPEIAMSQGELCTAMNTVRISLMGKNVHGYNFSIRLRSKIEGHWHSVRIGAYVKFKNKALMAQTYWIEVFGSEDSEKLKNKVIYRFHFDVAVPGEINKKDHPIYHIQIGGKVSEAQYATQDMKHWSIPRIPYVPLSLAMFLEIVLREFGDDVVKRFVKSKEWNNMLLNNQKVMLCQLAKTILNNGDKTIFSIYYEGL